MLWLEKIDVTVPYRCYRFLDETKMSDVVLNALWKGGVSRVNNLFSG
jgi:hypothetical protein